MFNLVPGVTVALCQSAVGSQSILAPVDLADPHGDQFLESCGHRAGIHDRPEMGDHRPEVFWTVRDGTEHVRNVAALFEVCIEYLLGFAAGFAGFKSFDAHV